MRIKFIIVVYKKYLLGIDAGIVALDVLDTGGGVDEERELSNIMNEIEECKRNMESLDKSFDFLKSELESAMYGSEENSAITSMNFEDFTNRYLNSWLEILSDSLGPYLLRESRWPPCTWTTWSPTFVRSTESCSRRRRGDFFILDLTRRRGGGEPNSTE